MLIRGILGAAREAALAARCLLVTVEAAVQRLEAAMNAVVLPHWMVSAVSIVPGGAHPSYAAGCYERDNRFYVAWDDIARDRDHFAAVDARVRVRQPATMRSCCAGLRLPHERPRLQRG